MIPAKASPLQSLRAALASGEMTPRNVTEQVLGKINSNAGRNVYLALDGQRALHEAKLLPSRFSSTPRPLLYGVPVSLKDCFDLAGFPTSCGSRFYATQNGFAGEDSAVAAALLGQGALIVGKTHLNQLAYGITGENLDYGDCVQPRDATWLTGGSSSGAAASVQEGSAIAAIGTDTGGSVRVPAALCGLAGYRASIDLAYQNGLAYGRGLWHGGMHLAPSFDTVGWLFRDLRDGPVLAEALFGLQIPCTVETRVRIGCVNAEFLRDCQPAVMEGFRQWQQQLCECGAHIVPIDTGFWDEAMDIFAPLQAHEAAAIHQRNTGSDFSCFEQSIAERLRWGTSIPEKELERLRQLHADFRDRMDALLRDFDFLIIPCAPINRLAAGGDHSQTRGTMLRYTTPMSLAGVPVVALPAENGAGVQLVAGRGADARLLAYSARASISPPTSN